MVKGSESEVVDTIDAGGCIVVGEAGRGFWIKGSMGFSVADPTDCGVIGPFGRKVGVEDLDGQICLMRHLNCFQMTYIIPCRRLKVQTLSLCLQLTHGSDGFSMMHRTLRARQRLQALETLFLVDLVVVDCILTSMTLKEIAKVAGKSETEVIDSS